MHVLIVDDHPILHQTLRVVARTAIPGAEIHVESNLGDALIRADRLREGLTLLGTVAALLFSATPLFAGQYVLVKGKGVDVCEAYRKNLNSFDPNEPMRCDRPVDPEFKDFEKPKWGRIDALKEFALILQVDKLLRPRYYANVKPEVIRSSLRANIESGNYKFSVITVDIDNDGQMEPVLRYLDSCWPGHRGPWGTPLVVLTLGMKDVDAKKTQLVAQVPGRVDAYEGVIYDVFGYKGTTYFDYWSEERGPLRVMRSRSGVTKEVCQMRFVQ